MGEWSSRCKGISICTAVLLRSRKNSGIMSKKEESVQYFAAERDGYMNAFRNCEEKVQAIFVNPS